MKETDIQRQICEYLTLKKHFFFRVNNVPISIMQGNKRVFRSLPKYARHGVPDILLVKDGQFIGIEVKADKGVQSEHQKQFCADVLAAGGWYFIARSLEDVIAQGL